MAGETTLTIVGNLTAAPELKHLASGAAVANFNVASTPRYFAREAGQWRDGEAVFMRCSAWKTLAENAAASLSKGTRVIVTGRLKQRTYQTSDGENRTVFELDVDEIGPSVRWTTTTVTKTTTGSAGQGNSGYGATGGVGTPASDPWTNPASATGQHQPSAPPF